MFGLAFVMAQHDTWFLPNLIDDSIGYTDTFVSCMYELYSYVNVLVAWSISVFLTFIQLSLRFILITCDIMFFSVSMTLAWHLGKIVMLARSLHFNRWHLSWVKIYRLSWYFSGWAGLILSGMSSVMSIVVLRFLQGYIQRHLSSSVFPYSLVSQGLNLSENW